MTDNFFLKYFKLPKPSNKEGRKSIIVGLNAPNGKVCKDNPIWKIPVKLDLEGYIFRYEDENNRTVEVTVEIK